MSSRQIYEDERCKTMVAYRDEIGLSIERIDLRTKQRSKLLVTPQELDGLMTAWPELKDFLSNAGALPAGPATRSPSGSKGSQVPGNSPSSRPATLL